MILDLGCGGNLHPGATGVDIVGRPKTSADIICLLGFEPIPVEDSSVDKCISEHFIEHLPGQVWDKEQVLERREDYGDVYKWVWKRHLPLVYLFNDVYRVLKHNGIFSVRVPVYPHQQSFQDPTHAFYWVAETVHYFCGDYYSFHDVYGHTSRFECIHKSYGGANGWWLDFDLRAVKTLPKDYPYELKYQGV